MTAAAQPEPGGDTGRVRCLYCGANNFPSSAACWQCSRPLHALRDAPAQPPSFPQAPGYSQPPLAPASIPGSMPPSFRTPLTDSALAPKVAAALGMLFPFVGLPAGMIFLMLDDPRKTQLGWLLIGWSVAGSLINIVGLAITLGPVLAVMKGLLPHPGGAAPAIPGLPTDGSSGDGLNLLLLICLHACSLV